MKLKGIATGVNILLSYNDDANFSVYDGNFWVEPPRAGMTETDSLALRANGWFYDDITDSWCCNV